MGEDGILYKHVPEMKAFAEDEVCIIAPGGRAGEEHGTNCGGQVVTLTAEQLKALNNGSQLAIDIMGCEYMLFLNGPAAKRQSCPPP